MAYQLASVVDTVNHLLRRPRVMAAAVAIIVAGWTIAVGRNGWTLNLDAPRCGLAVAGDALSLRVAVRWGWPSRVWVRRDALRAPGEGAGIPFETRDTALGFAILIGARTWFGNNNIAVWHAGLAVPWWYLIALAAAAPLQGVAIHLWRLPRRAERRRRAGQCVACGYDLTGNVSGVSPECGAGAIRK